MHVINNERKNHFLCIGVFIVSFFYSISVIHALEGEWPGEELTIDNIDGVVLIRVFLEKENPEKKVDVLRWIWKRSEEFTVNESTLAENPCIPEKKWVQSQLQEQSKTKERTDLIELYQKTLERGWYTAVRIFEQTDKTSSVLSLYCDYYSAYDGGWTEDPSHKKWSEALGKILPEEGYMNIDKTTFPSLNRN